MNNITIIFDLNKDDFEIQIEKKIKTVILKHNIYDLEKFPQSHLYLIEHDTNVFLILNSLFKKKKMCVKYIIVNTVYPSAAKLFEQYDSFYIDTHIMFKIKSLLNFIRSILIFNKKFSLIFLLHEVNKNQFFYENLMYNSIIIGLMSTLHNEYRLTKSISVLCVATNNMFLSYKESIYPYIKVYTSNVTSISALLLKIISKFVNKVIFF